jgi:hypothetical protein
MKPKLLFFSLALLVGGCNNSHLFSPSEQENKLDPLDGPSATAIIEMQVTGGFAGVTQQLQIFTNRYTQYIDLSQTSQLASALSNEEYGELVALFVEKDFLHMQPSYLDPNIADAFYYRLTFRYSGTTKQVETDYLSAPSALQNLVDRLREVSDWLSHSLKLELRVSTDTLHHGETLVSSLNAVNQSANPITLQFRDGQTYDFFAAIPATKPAFPPSLVWNWAHDQYFIQVLRSETLKGGETLTYSIEWDGRSNNGELLVGEFWLGARLVSLPGGYTTLRRVVVIP